MAAYREQHLENWLVEPIPMLGGMSPTQAARTPAGRAKLDELLAFYEQMPGGDFNANPDRAWVHRRLNIGGSASGSGQGDESFPTGCHVELHGLATTSLNGKRGTVVGPRSSNGRISVRLAIASLGTKAVKPQNLRLASPFATDARQDAWFRLRPKPTAQSGVVSTRVHVEIREAPVLADQGERMCYCVQPESGYCWPVPLAMSTHGDGLREYARWAPLLANGLRDKLMAPMDASSSAFGRPTLITAMDPVVVEALSEALGGHGTTVALAFDNEVITSGFDRDGTSLVAIMDGVAAALTRETRSMLEGKGNSLSTKGPGRVRRNRRGGFETDMPGVPRMAWACVHCRRLMHAAEASPCASCHVAHFCSAACKSAADHADVCRQLRDERARATRSREPTAQMVAAASAMRDEPTGPDGERTIWRDSRVHVTLLGIDDKPELNGREGFFEGTVRSGGEHKVELLTLAGEPSGRTVWVNGEHVRLGVDPRRAARARAFAERQMSRAVESVAQEPQVAGARLVSSLEIMRSLPPVERSAQFVARAAARLAESVTALPAMASASAEALRQYVRADDWSETPAEHQATVERALTQIEATAPEETRPCDYCGAIKPRSGFTNNQWRKGKRRCIGCQESNVERTLQQKADAEEAAEGRGALEACFEGILNDERRKAQEEQARMNANERDDDECRVCFESLSEDERCCLPCHSSHWTCRGCLANRRDALLKERQTDPGKMMICHMCRAEVADNVWGALLA